MQTDIKYILGIDLGGSHLAWGVTTPDGEIVQAGNLPIHVSTSYDTFLYTLKEIVEAWNVSSAMPIDAIGIAAPNGNFQRGTIEFAPNLPWKGCLSVVNDLQELVNIPVFIDNDANATILGEVKFGNAKSSSHALMLTLGTGLGSGLWVNGAVLRGSTGYAGEFGHIILYPEGRSCTCGRKGCAEAYISTRGLIQTWTELENTSTVANVLQLTSLAKEGNLQAIKAFKTFGKHLGFLLSQAVTILNPERIILFGGITGASDFFLETACLQMESNLLPIFKNTANVQISSLKGTDAALLGAASLAH